jgi:pantoate--beta-alanine ligase
MQRFETVAALRDALAPDRARSASIALVPTMGALHEGHLSLVDEARARARTVVVSVFVNPAQFGPGEDLERYPRDLEGDAELCGRRGADIVFAPPVEEVYGRDHRTWVTVEGITEGLCGAFRPTHFRGMITVVVKLLNMVQPDMAVFGRKDYQQLRVIETAVRDLHVPVQVIGAPTVRDADGLALSSRNAYLSAEQRARARVVPEVLSEAWSRWEAGGTRVGGLVAGLAGRLARSADSVDYFGAYDPVTLVPLPADAEPERGPLVALAVHVGSTRLIDNVELGVDPPPLRARAASS